LKKKKWEEEKLNKGVQEKNAHKKRAFKPNAATSEKVERKR